MANEKPRVHVTHMYEVPKRPPPGWNAGKEARFQIWFKEGCAGAEAVPISDEETMSMLSPQQRADIEQGLAWMRAQPKREPLDDESLAKLDEMRMRYIFDGVMPYIVQDDVEYFYGRVYDHHPGITESAAVIFTPYEADPSRGCALLVPLDIDRILYALAKDERSYFVGAFVKEPKGPFLIPRIQDDEVMIGILRRVMKSGKRRVQI